MDEISQAEVSQAEDRQAPATETAGGRAWMLVLAAALCALVACVLRPWVSDRPAATPLAPSGPRPTNAYASIQALAGSDVGKGWPQAALLGVLVTAALWGLGLLAGLLRRQWPGSRKSKLACAALTAETLAVAAVTVEAIRQVGAHATAILVAAPAPLVVGAVTLAMRLPLSGARRIRTGRRRTILPALGAIVVVAATTVAFAHSYTTSWRISATTTSLPTAPQAAAPSRPGTSAWHIRRANSSLDVRQAGGYTAIADNHNADSGSIGGEVMVVDSVNGRQRWHYRRADADVTLVSVTVSAPQALVVQTHDLADHVMLLGFDLASGRRLWSASDGQTAKTTSSLVTGGASPDEVFISDVAPRWVRTSPNLAVTAPSQNVVGRNARTGRVVWTKYIPACGIWTALKQADTLLLEMECSADKAPARLEAFGLTDGRPQWQTYLPVGVRPISNVDYTPTQISNDVVAVPAYAAKPDEKNPDLADWTFYRLSDGRALWHEDGVGSLQLAGDRVFSADARGVPSLRDAVTGHTLWQENGSKPGLRVFPTSGLSAVSSSGHLYVMYSNIAVPTAGNHVMLLTFDTRSGLRGSTDLTDVSGDPCPAVGTTPLCATQSLEGAGASVVVTEADHTSYKTVSGIADGSGFTPSR
jgi:outer membrane protein assembly factor BamB